MLGDKRDAGAVPLVVTVVGDQLPIIIVLTLEFDNQTAHVYCHNFIAIQQN